MSGIELMIGCNIPEIISHLKQGDPIKIDDGIVEGVIKEVTEEGAIVETTKVDSKKGVRLKAEKGLNFPASEVKMEFITDKDKMI